MKTFRQFLILILSSSLVNLPAYAGPEDDARTYVQSSQEGAHDKAMVIFQQYLQEAAIQASKVSEYSDTFSESSRALADQIDKLQSLRLKLAKGAASVDVNSLDGVSEQVQGIYEKLSALYTDARTAEKVRNYLILKNGQRSSLIDEAFKNFLSNISTTCSNGIAANFQFPSLPAIRPVVPSFFVGAEATFGGGGEFSGRPSIPSVQTPKLNGNTAAAVYATTYAGGFALGAYLVTGKVVLTTAAAQALTTTSFLAASGIGLAAAAVVALVVYFDGLFSAIKQSHEVTNALWIVHNESASAETVRSEFKKICQPFAERAAKIPSRIEAIAAKDETAVADYDSEREQVKQDQIELMNLQKQLDDQLQTLVKTMEGDPATANLSPALKAQTAKSRLASDSAMVAIKNKIQELGADNLMNMFDVSLMEIGLHYRDTEKAMRAQYQELFKNQTEGYLDKIVELAQLGRRLAVPQNVRDLVQAEIKTNAQISALFREFDLAFADFVQTELTFGQDTTFRSKLADWLKKVGAAQAATPASPTLKILAERGSEFTKFLNAGVR